jgi:hypothetical protein
MPYRQEYYARPTAGYDYSGQSVMTGTNGIVVGRSPVWPTPSTSGETMDKLKAWLDKPTMESHPTVKNKHVAIVVGVSAIAGLAWYGSKHRWF